MSESRWFDYDLRDALPQYRTRSDVEYKGGVAALGPDVRLTWNRFGQPASVYREAVALTDPVRGDPEDIARAFLRGPRQPFAFTPRQADGLLLAARDVTGGVTFLQFSQAVRGLAVYGGYVKVAVNARGEVVFAAAGDVLGEVDLAVEAPLRPDEAVRAAYRSLGLDEPTLDQRPGLVENNAVFRNPAGPSFADILTELVVFPVAADSARLAYRISLEIDHTNWFEILVDAGDGGLLLRRSLYQQAAQGRVWRESPQKGERELVAFPTGWIPAASQVAAGNNADVYLDRDGDNAPDPTSAPDLQNGRAYSPSQNFDFLAGEGTTSQDPRGFPAAALTNAFYFVNLAHDYFYGLGFNEPAGNMQNDNFGRGGAAGDAVVVHSQCADALNGAMISTPADGTRPVLHLGLFTRGTSAVTDDLDSSYSGQIVVHEYAHAVTRRMIGAAAPAACLNGIQSRALSEGWSDYFAASVFGNPVMGAYDSQNAVRGVRRQSYEGYALTYQDIGNQGYEVHRDGEIWAATLWDLRKTLVQAVADRLVFDGLRFTACNPSMIDARDGILLADRNLQGGVNRTRIWQVFARHGMGFSAAGVDGSALRGTMYTASSDLPPDLHTGNRPPSILSRPSLVPAAGDLYSYTVEASDPDGGRVAYQLTEGPAGMALDANTGLLRWPATFVGKRVKITVADGQGGASVHGFLIAVDTPLIAGTPVTIDGLKDSFGYARFTVAAGIPVWQLTLRGGQGDPDVLVVNPDGAAVKASERLGAIETLSLPSPKTGVWRIVVGGFESYSGVALAAATPVPALMPGKGSKTGLSGELSTETFFRVTVPPGATALRVSTSEGVGDVDLFARRGSVPDCQVVRVSPTLKRLYGSGCSSRSAGFDTNAETISLGAPESGEWYFTLSASAGYSGVTFTTALTAPPTLAVGGSELAFVAVEGGPAPPSQNLSISDTSGGAFSWTAQAATASGGNWLLLSAASGTGDAALAVSVRLAGLAPGTYRGSITITAAALAGSPRTVAVSLDLAARPRLAVALPALEFSVLQGRDPAPQALAISNAGGGTLAWVTSAATASGGSWLSVNPERGTGNATLQVAIRSAAMLAGAYNGSITITASDAAGSPAVVRVALTVIWPVTLTAEGVVNAGSFSRNRPIAPNEILSLFGNGFTDPCSPVPSAANPCPSARSFPLPTQLGATRVTFNGVAAPLLLVTPTQVNMVVPFGLTGPSVEVVISRGSVSSPPLAIPLAEQSLGIFTVLSNGSGAGILLHADGRLVSREAPTQTEEVLILFGTGMGPVSPAIPTGTPAPATPLSETVVPMRVFFDGGEGRILFSGPAPGFVGLYQINVLTPSFLARRFPVVRVQSESSVSNDVSAGGPSVLDVSPPTARAGADVTVTVRGVNLASSSALRVGGEDLPAVTVDGPLQTLTTTIPARLLARPGELALAVVDREAPQEAPSNPIRLLITSP